MLTYLSKIPSSINQAEFEKVVRSICADPKIRIANPNWLMICMNAESNMKLVTNGIGAYGFIQFTKSTALDLGTSVGKLKIGTWQNYMDYVRKYLQERVKERGIPQSAYELYALIHFPVAFQKSGSYVLYAAGSDAYAGNKNLDYNNDGKVQWSEVMKFLDSKCPILYDKTQLLKPENLTNNYYYVNYSMIEVGIIAGTVAVVGIILLVKSPRKLIQKLKYRFTHGKAN